MPIVAIVVPSSMGSGRLIGSHKNSPESCWLSPYLKHGANRSPVGLSPTV